MITSGRTRVVLQVGPWAIKIPRIDLGGRQFVLGLLANLQERDLSRVAGSDARLARTHFAAPLGLVAVAERIRGPALGRRLEPAELFDLPLQEFSGESGVDDNGGNVKRRGDGSLVVVDYGNPGVMYVAEGPRLVRGQPRVVVRCTGISASWCPRCGDCKCPERGEFAGDMDSPDCPLHALNSTHGDDADDDA